MKEFAKTSNVASTYEEIVVVILGALSGANYCSSKC